MLESGTVIKYKTTWDNGEIHYTTVDIVADITDEGGIAEFDRDDGEFSVTSTTEASLIVLPSFCNIVQIYGVRGRSYGSIVERLWNSCIKASNDIKHCYIDALKKVVLPENNEYYRNRVQFIDLGMGVTVAIYCYEIEIAYKTKEALKYEPIFYCLQESFFGYNNFAHNIEVKGYDILWNIPNICKFSSMVNQYDLRVILDQLEEEGFRINEFRKALIELGYCAQKNIYINPLSYGEDEIQSLIQFFNEKV